MVERERAVRGDRKGFYGVELAVVKEEEGGVRVHFGIEGKIGCLRV